MTPQVHGWVVEERMPGGEWEAAFWVMATRKWARLQAADARKAAPRTWRYRVRKWVRA